MYCLLRSCLSLIVENACLPLHSTIHLVWKKQRPIHLKHYGSILPYIEGTFATATDCVQYMERANAGSMLHKGSTVGLLSAGKNTRKSNINITITQQEKAFHAENTESTVE